MQDKNKDNDRQLEGSPENPQQEESDKKEHMKIILPDNLNEISGDIAEPISSEKTEEDRFWEEALQTNKKADYEKYHEKYPDGKYDTQAADELYYRFITLGELTIEECSTYLKRYPDGRHAEEIRWKLEERNRKRLIRQLNTGILLCLIIMGCVVHIIRYTSALRSDNKGGVLKEEVVKVIKAPPANRVVNVYYPDIYEEGQDMEIEEYSSFSYFKKGLEYIENGRYDLAILQFNKGIERDSDQPLAYFNRGFAYYETGRYDLAIKDYGKVIELDPADPSAYHNRAISYKETGRYDLAIPDYSKAIELDPDDSSHYFNRGFAYYESGRYDQAVTDYSKSIELDPADSTAYHNRGYAYNEKGDYDRAISDFSEAIELDAENSAAYQNRGFAYIEKGEYELAVSDYSKAIELDPDNPSVYYARGLIYNMMGDNEFARKDFQSAREMGYSKADLELYLMR